MVESGIDTFLSNRSRGTVPFGRPPVHASSSIAANIPTLAEGAARLTHARGVATILRKGAAGTKRSERSPGAGAGPFSILPEKLSGDSSMTRLCTMAFVLLVCVGLLLPMAAADTPEVLTRQAPPFPVILDPPGDEEEARYHVLRGDFHIHTPHSDGKVPPADRVLEAWRYGYDVIAITDHGNFRAYDEALPVAEALGMIFLRGIETGLSGQEHLVALDFSADYEPRNPHHWAEAEGEERVFYQEQWRRLDDAGGFVLYAHPHVGLREPMLWGIEEGLLRGIEVKNDVVGTGWGTVESHGTHWYPFALDWALEHDLAVFANSDIHGARDDTPQAVTLVLAEEQSVEGVVDAFESGRTIAYFNDMLVAREELLALLIGNLVDVRLSPVDDEQTWLRIENRGPIALEASVEAAGLAAETVELGPYAQVLVGPAFPPADVTIEWTNLWTRSTENLTTTHTVTVSDAP